MYLGVQHEDFTRCERCAGSGRARLRAHGKGEKHTDRRKIGRSSCRDLEERRVISYTRARVPVRAAGRGRWGVGSADASGDGTAAGNERRRSRDAGPELLMIAGGDVRGHRSEDEVTAAIHDLVPSYHDADFLWACPERY